MNTSKIEWTDRTWNPVSGCSHVSEGCRNCYAERFFPRVYGKERVPLVKHSIHTLDPSSANFNAQMRSRKFTDVQCHPERLDQPLKIKKPQRIFVNSMSDLFHEDVPDEFIDRVFAVIALAPQHIFQVLTKRPARMLAYLASIQSRGAWLAMEDFALELGYEPRGKDNDGFDWLAHHQFLPNVWLGVSVEDQQTADERIPLLLQTPAAVRWISAEPLLGPIDFEFPEIEIAKEKDGHGTTAILGGLDWVVVGGESGHKVRPMKPWWVHDIYDQCREADVPFFMKQGSQANWPDFKDIRSFPTRLQVREFPQ